MTSAKSQEYNIDELKNSTNVYQRASNQRILLKPCAKCGDIIGEVGGTAFRTSSATWYCSNCNPLNRLK